LGPLDRYGVATYDLEYIKALLSRERYHITKKAQKGATSLGYASDVDIIERVLKVLPTEIHKTMPAEKGPPGTMQDVYNSVDEEGQRIYIKLQISAFGDSVIVSFKPWGQDGP
jgi:hypothetical protein